MPRRSLWQIAVLLAVLGFGYVWGQVGVTRGWFPAPQIAAFRNPAPATPASALEKPAIYRGTAELYARYGQPADLVIVGDSMLAGMPWNEMLPARSVANRTISGDLALWLPERLDPVVATGARQAIVMIGINDAQAGRSAAAIHGDILEVVRTLSAAGMAVTVVPALPCTAGTPDCGAAGATLARLSQLLARDAGGARLIDLWPTMAPRGVLLDRYSSDGVHFNADSVALLLNRIR